MERKSGHGGPSSTVNFSRNKVATTVATILVINLILSELLLTPVEAKGMARGLNRNGGGGRTYLKKFGTRNVVYQRKIFNSKYQSGDEIGFVGRTASDKFKKKISDGTAASHVIRLHTDEDTPRLTALLPEPEIPVEPISKDGDSGKPLKRRKNSKERKKRRRERKRKLQRKQQQRESRPKRTDAPSS